MTACSVPAYTAGSFGRFGCASPDETLGTRFTAVGDSCTGGVIYTGSGAGWSAVTAYLWRVSTGTLLQTVGVTTGAADTAYPFNWPSSQALVPGADYIVAFSKFASSCFAANADNALFGGGGFYTPIEHIYSVGIGVMPATTIGDRPGVEPIVCNAGGYCQYGTRVQPGQSNVLILDEAVIAAAATVVPELAIFAVVWGAFVGWTYVPGNVCASPPPDMPAFTDADFLFGTQVPAPGSIGKFWQALQVALWPLYCQCLPAPGGSPPPIPEPPPSVSPPPSGTPTPPGPIVCDAADVCATLNAIIRQLTVLTAQLAYTRADVQLIQRQGVPFGYTLGTAHSALSNAGDFTVSDILGLAVTFTTLPGIYQAIPGDPDTYHQIGKVSVGTIDGWERSWMPTHSPYMILAISGAVTKVGYAFPPGIVATITELVREP
jgi:hypothetical protein